MPTMADEQRELFPAVAVPSSSSPKKKSNRGNPAPRRSVDDLVNAIGQYIILTGRGPANYEEVALLLETTFTQSDHTIREAQMARRVVYDVCEFNIVPPLDTKARVLRDAEKLVEDIGFTAATIRTRLFEFLQQLAAESKKGRVQ